MLNQAVSLGTSKTSIAASHPGPSRNYTVREMHGDKRDDTAVVTDFELVTVVNVAEPENARAPTRYSNRMPV